MPNIDIANIDPSHGQPGAGFCLLIQVSPGSGAPRATLSYAGQEMSELDVSALDAQRGLWSTYIDDGPDLGPGVITVSSEGCRRNAGTPVRE